jgi:hypothetical protein
MKIISFAWTTQALLEGKKTVTRRDWNDRYAKTYHKDDIVQAYSKNPRCGGKKIAEIRLTADPYKQWLHEMTDEDEIKEGHLWGNAEEYRKSFVSKSFSIGKDKKVWVIEFEIVIQEARDVKGVGYAE